MYHNQCIEIAENPLKAHTYGNPWVQNWDTDVWKGLYFKGFSSYTETITTPHPSLFQNVGDWRWENISSDGIITEMYHVFPIFNYMKYPTMTWDESQKYSTKICRVVRIL